MNTMSVTALVLGGGGSRGAYEIGVWRALREHGEAFSVVTGTSVGALNGAIIAQDDYDLAVDVWSTITTEMILSIDSSSCDKTLRERLSRFGLFAREIAANKGADSTPLRTLLYRVLDEDKIRASAMRFGLVTVKLPELSPRALFADEIPRGELIDYILASAACFPAMQKQVIGDKAYIDGGYFDNLPIELASRGGAEHVIAVDVHGIGICRRPENVDHARIHLITTAWNLGSILLFDAANARRNMELGYLDTLKSFGKLDGKLYALEKGEAAKLRPATERLHAAFDHHFPPAKRGAIGLYDLLRLRTLRFMKNLYRGLDAPPQLKSNRRRAGEIDLHLAAVENAARVFDVSPTKIYTARCFEEAIRDAYAATDLPDPSRLEAILAADTAPRRAERLLAEAESITSARVARYLGELLSRPSVSQALLVAAATALPAEFQAALYIRALSADPVLPLSC